MSISSQKIPLPRSPGSTAIRPASKSATRSRCNPSITRFTTPILRAAKSIFPNSLRKMLGMKPEDPALTTGNIIETIHPDDRPAYREAIVAHFRGDTPRFEVDFRFTAVGWRLALVPPVRRRGAPPRRARLSHRRRDERCHRGAPARPRAGNRARRSCRRLSPARQPVGPLTAAEERYALAMESINFGLYDWNLTNDSVYFSPGLRIQLGLTSGGAFTTGALAQSHASRATGRCITASWSSISRARRRALPAMCAI